MRPPKGIRKARLERLQNSGNEGAWRIRTDVSVKPAVVQGLRIDSATVQAQVRGLPSRRNGGPVAAAAGPSSFSCPDSRRLIRRERSSATTRSSFDDARAMGAESRVRASYPSWFRARAAPVRLASTRSLTHLRPVECDLSHFGGPSRRARGSRGRCPRPSGGQHGRPREAVDSMGASRYLMSDIRRNEGKSDRPKGIPTAPVFLATSTPPSPGHGMSTRVPSRTERQRLEPCPCHRSNGPLGLGRTRPVRRSLEVLWKRPSGSRSRSSRTVRAAAHRAFGGSISSRVSASTRQAPR